MLHLRSNFDHHKNCAIGRVCFVRMAMKATIGGHDLLISLVSLLAIVCVINVTP